MGAGDGSFGLHVGAHAGSRSRASSVVLSASSPCSDMRDRGAQSLPLILPIRNRQTQLPSPQLTRVATAPSGAFSALSGSGDGRQERDSSNGTYVLGIGEHTLNQYGNRSELAIQSNQIAGGTKSRLAHHATTVHVWDLYTAYYPPDQPSLAAGK